MSSKDSFRVKLNREAEQLAWLLGKRREDYRFLNSPPSDTPGTEKRSFIVYAIDYSDLSAFIEPENQYKIDSFLFEFERESLSLMDGNDLISDLRLKQEALLSEILFDHNTQTIVLPSHWEELEDRIEYTAHEWLSSVSNLFDLAQEHLETSLKDKKKKNMFDSLLDIYRGDELLGETDKSELIELFEELSPALLEIFAEYERGSGPRVELLLNRSNFVHLQNMDWAPFAVSSRGMSVLREFRPDLSEIERWRRHLTRLPYRSGSSDRANRIDAQAIVMLKRINDILQDTGNGHVRVCLLTRATTLIHASRARQVPADDGLRAIEYLRHPRIYISNRQTMAPARLQLGLRPALTLPRRDESMVSMKERDPEAPLINALNEFRSALRQASQDGEIVSGEREDHYNNALKSLLAAWQDFEAAMFTIDLHRAEVAVPSTAKQLGTTRIFELFGIVERFQKEPDIEPLVLERLGTKIWDFRRRTVSLAGSDDKELTGWLVMPPEHRIVRLVAHPHFNLGAIEFTDDGLLAWLRNEKNERGRVLGLGTILIDFHPHEDVERLRLPQNRYERYLAWALFHAALGRWALAEHYSSAAVKSVGQVDAMPHEAWYLRSQVVRRRGFQKSTPEKFVAAVKKARDLLKRAIVGRQRVTATGNGGDARYLREKAAQILAARLAAPKKLLGAQPLLSQGLEILGRAIDVGDGADAYLRAQLYQLGLCYALAMREHPSLLGERETEVSVEQAQLWHQRLNSSLDELRHEGWEGSELPALARAVNFLTYAYFPPLERPELEPLVREALSVAPESERGPRLAYSRVRMLEPVIRIIERDDEIGALIVKIATPLVQGAGARAEREMTYAPVHAELDSQRIVEDFFPSGCHNLAKEAFKLRDDVADPETEVALDDHERESILDQMADKLEKVHSEIEKAAPYDGLVTAFYYSRMELAYCKFLKSRLLHRSRRAVGSRRLLEKLCSEYEGLARDYPQASIPLFRLSTVLDQLERIDEAIARLREARMCFDDDPYVEKAEWVRLTMDRRLGVLLFRKAQAMKAAAENATGDDDLDAPQALMLEAFAITLQSYQHPTNKDEAWSELESQWLANNLLYLAVSYLDEDYDRRELEARGYCDALEEELLAVIGANEMDRINDHDILDTLSAVYRLRGESEMEREAARMVRDLLLDRGEAFWEQKDIEQMRRALASESGVVP